MAEDDQEKSEQATEKRREDFRKKGQVAQSREVQTAALFTGTLLLWNFYLPTFWTNLQALIARLFSESGTFDITPVSIIDLSLFLAAKVTLLLAPLLVLVLAVGFFSTFFQIGWLLTGKPLEPDFSKLNPISGFGRMFSKRSLIEVVKSLAKVSLIAFVAYRTVSAEFAEGLNLVQMEVGETANYLARVCFWVLAKTCGILILLALLDFLYVRWELEQKMKMSKQELKEEFKESEGDPYIKARVRTIQREMARKRMMADVPKADVVITNPTHLSIAIVYRRGEADAPVVLAKGADNIAMRIREIAREHDVPLVENVPVARALYQVEIGQPIPEELFKAVAEILAYVYSLKGPKT
jgi:flagellar biosynthetic protein FlhB